MKTIFNSLKGFSSVAIILIALGIIAVGSGIYFLASPTQPTQPTQQITNAPEESAGNMYPIITPSVQEENQPITTPTITNPIDSPTTIDVSNLSLVYALSKDKGFSIVLYNPIQKTKQIIKESEIGQIIKEIRKDISPDKYFYYIYYDDYSQSLIKSDLFGKTLDAIAVFIIDHPVVISQNRQKLAWCQRDGALAVYDFSTEHIKSFKDDFVCGLSALNSAFSKDGSKFYYTKGLYEVYGDYTDEEMEKMRREAQVGLHSIDLLTGQSTFITPSYPIFWNESEKINLQQKIAINLKDPSGDTIEVKRLNNTNFDYLTPEQLNQLPTITKLQFPAERYTAYKLSLDGGGIFYGVRFNDGREGFGYFDIASGKNYFPISTLNKDEYLLDSIAINKNLIFYAIAKNDGGIESSKLYKTTINGQNELIDSATESIILVDIVKK